MEIECQCGATAPIIKDTWVNWVQLGWHRQPKTGLLCNPSRLQWRLGEEFAPYFSNEPLPPSITSSTD